jgi:ubiquinone/menaquinone biosynthesis C-methylase UbiE
VPDPARGDPAEDAKSWLAGVFDRAAPTYDRIGDAYHDHFGELLVELAAPPPGSALLDVACGRGAALLPAARRVGPGGTVLGVDISPVMVALAEAALAGHDLPGTVRVGDAEALDVPDESMDTVLCAFGLFFFPDAESAVAELLRVLRPGGTLALSTWGAEDERWAWEDDLFGGLDVGRRAVVRAFDAPGEVASLLQDAGFVDVVSTEARYEVRFADADAWWEWKWSYSLRGVLEQVDEATTTSLRRTAGEHLRRLAGPDGLPLRLTANLVRARRPRAAGS